MEVGFGLPYKLYQKLLCLLLVCTSPTVSGISTLTQEGSQVFGISAQTDNGIRIWHPYILYQKLLPTSGLLLSPTLSGISTLTLLWNSSDLVLEIGILIYSTRSYCLLLVCNLLTLSGISTLSQEGLNSLESQFRLTVVLGSGIPYILYQKLLCLPLVCTSPTL